MRSLIILFSLSIISQFSAFGENIFESDIIKSKEGDIKITFIGHGTLLFEFKKMNIHIDPYSRLAEYSALPDADMILITHQHKDHFDQAAIADIATEGTDFIVTETVFEKLEKGTILRNNESAVVNGINIEAVPAYNIVNKRDSGEPYHPKGEGNGYILTMGDKRIYVAGDTENIPEMNNLKNIDIAFIPMNLPYTMDPEMAAKAVESFNPKVVYPYHYGETDPKHLAEKLKGRSSTEVIIREMR